MKMRGIKKRDLMIHDASYTRQPTDFRSNFIVDQTIDFIELP